MMEALRPLGVVQVYRSITAYPSNAAEQLSSQSLVSDLTALSNSRKSSTGRSATAQSPGACSTRSGARNAPSEDQRCEGNQKDGDKHTVTNYLLAAIRLCRTEPRDVWAEACAGLRSMPDVHDLNIDVSVLAVALDLQSHLFPHSDALKLIGQVWQSAHRLAFDRHDHVPYPPRIDVPPGTPARF